MRSDRKNLCRMLLITSLIVVVPNVLSTFTIIAEPGNQNEVLNGKPWGAIGQGFFVPDEDLLSSELTGRGATIFDHIPKNCLVETPVAVDRKDESFYSSTKSIYSAISTDTNIELNLKGKYTMGASLRAVTNNLATEDSEVTGNSLQLYTETLDFSITQDCFNDQRLNRKFLKAFTKLPKKIAQPHFKQAWEPYRIFLKKYGSHVVSTVLSGASIYQYAFADKDKSYSERNFTVKACASLAGKAENVEKLPLSACAGITQKDINDVAKLKIIEKLVVRGGTAGTRADLTNKRDIETIKKFLLEGKANASPILYKFVPIWDILQARYVGTQFMAQARNLEEFYKGFLDYGCDYQTTANGQHALQKFAHTPNSEPDFPSYQCMLGPTGCHDDNDCHYKSPFWCACAGQSCIRYYEKDLNSGDVKTEAKTFHDVSPGWAWHGCRLSGLTCWCTAENDNWEVVWRDDRQHVLRKVHQTVSRRMGRANAMIEALENSCGRK